MLCCNPTNANDQINETNIDGVWEDFKRNENRCVSSLTKQSKKSSSKNKSMSRLLHNKHKDNKVKYDNNAQFIGAFEDFTSQPTIPNIKYRSASTGNRREEVGWGLNWGFPFGNQTKISSQENVEKLKYSCAKRSENIGNVKNSSKFNSNHSMEKSNTSHGRPLRTLSARRNRSRSKSRSKHLSILACRNRSNNEGAKKEKRFSLS